jgi:hypothetical protein
VSLLIKIRPGRKEPTNGYPVYSDINNEIHIGAMAGWRIKPNQNKDFAFNFLGGFRRTTVFYMTACKIYCERYDIVSSTSSAISLQCVKKFL